MLSLKIKNGIRRVLIEMGLQETLWYIYKRYEIIPRSTVTYHDGNIKTTKIHYENDCLVVYHEKLDEIPNDLVTVLTKDME